MFTIAAQIVLHSVVKAMDWRNNVYVPVRKLLAIFFAIAIVTNSDSGKHWKHIFHGQVILNIGWQKMKLAVDLSVWTIYCMKHIFVLKLTFFCQTWIFFLDLRTFLSNFVPTDVNALLLKSYPEDFRPILSWASSNPILGRNLSSTPDVVQGFSPDRSASRVWPSTSSSCGSAVELSAVHIMKNWLTQRQPCEGQFQMRCTSLEPT